MVDKEFKTMDKRLLLLLLTFVLVILVNCTSEQEPVPDDCTDPPSLNLVGTTDAGCNLSNGSITVAGSGGSGDLIYSINGGSFQNNGTFTDLAAGTYTITVTDENNCDTDLQVDVSNADGLNVAIATVGTECGENQGSITITPSNAQGAVEYSLNGGAFQANNQFSGLAQGGYTITARDESGCEVEQEADIESDVTFGEIQLIMQGNCAVSGCHDGSQSPDLRTSGGITGSASRIMARTTARTMPPGGRVITDEQIAAIACWVEDGASGN